MGLLPELDKVITLPKLEFILPQTQISELHVPCADYIFENMLFIYNYYFYYFSEGHEKGGNFSSLRRNQGFVSCKLNLTSGI